MAETFEIKTSILLLTISTKYSTSEENIENYQYNIPLYEIKKNRLIKCYFTVIKVNSDPVAQNHKNGLGPLNILDSITTTKNLF